MSFSIWREESTRRIERRVISQAREHIRHLAEVARRISHAACCQERQPSCCREVREHAHHCILPADASSLHFHIQPVAAKNPFQPLHRDGGFTCSTALPRPQQRSFLITRQRDQSAR